MFGIEVQLGSGQFGTIRRDVLENNIISQSNSTKDDTEGSRNSRRVIKWPFIPLFISGAVAPWCVGTARERQRALIGCAPLGKRRATLKS